MTLFLTLRLRLQLQLLKLIAIDYDYPMLDLCLEHINLSILLEQPHQQLTSNAHTTGQLIHSWKMHYHNKPRETRDAKQNCNSPNNAYVTKPLAFI